MAANAAESGKKRKLMSEGVVSNETSLRDFLIAEHAEFRQSGSNRLAYLYSDVSQARVTNPAGYASTLAWWSALIIAIVSRGLQNGGGSKTDIDGSDKLILHLEDALTQRLRWEGAGRPSSLGTVAMHLGQSSPAQIVPKIAFMSSAKPINSFSWSSWLVSKLVAAPLWWSMSKIGLVDASGDMSEEKAWKLANGDWVVMPTLKIAADNLEAEFAQLNNVTSRLYRRTEFFNQYARRALPGQRLTQADVDVVLRYLERDRRILSTLQDVIKLHPSPLQGRENQDVSEIDVNILDVKSTENILLEQIADLEKRIADRQQTVAMYVRKSQKDLALSHLRSKKALQDILSKRTAALENIQSVLMKMDNADNDVLVMQAYQKATTTLKAMHARPELQLDHVQTTVDDLHDAVLDADEIHDAITLNNGQMSADLELNDQVKAELAGLEDELQEERRKTEGKERLNLPSVPTSAVGHKQTMDATAGRKEAEELRMQLDKLSLQREALPAQ